MIQAVLLDIDGVLTDGTVWVDSGGREIKRLSFLDIDAIFELKRAGIKVGFITGERNSFCRYVRRRFQPDFFLVGCKNKLASFRRLLVETGLDQRSLCYVGDSRKDIELLREAAYSFAPADTEWAVRRAARTVLRACRGQGVIREVVDRILGKECMAESRSRQQKKERRPVDRDIYIISGARREKPYRSGGAVKTAVGRKQQQRQGR